MGTASPVPFVSLGRTACKAKRSTANAVGLPITAKGHLIKAGRNFTAVGGAVRNLEKKDKIAMGNSFARIHPAGVVLLRY